MYDNQASQIQGQKQTTQKAADGRDQMFRLKCPNRKDEQLRPQKTEELV